MTYNPTFDIYTPVLKVTQGNTEYILNTSVRQWFLDGMFWTDLYNRQDQINLYNKITTQSITWIPEWSCWVVGMLHLQQTDGTIIREIDQKGGNDTDQPWVTFGSRHSRFICIHPLDSFDESEFSFDGV